MHRRKLRIRPSPRTTPAPSIAHQLVIRKPRQRRRLIQTHRLRLLRRIAPQVEILRNHTLVGTVRPLLCRRARRRSRRRVRMLHRAIDHPHRRGDLPHRPSRKAIEPLPVLPENQLAQLLISAGVISAGPFLPPLSSCASSASVNPGVADSSRIICDSSTVFAGIGSSGTTYGASLRHPIRASKTLTQHSTTDIPRTTTRRTRIRPLNATPRPTHELNRTQKILGFPRTESQLKYNAT